MPRKELSSLPSGQGELTRNPLKTRSVWYSLTGVDFERYYGNFHRNDVHQWATDWPIYETRAYSDVSPSSLARLHKVIGKMVNENQATIRIFQMRDGAGYEAEIEG